jgi:hypothetical protein
MQFEETEDMSENHPYDDEYSTVSDKKEDKTSSFSLYKFLDKNKSGSIEWYEIHPIIILAAFTLFYYIIVTNITILVVFKQSKLFMLIFALMISYGFVYLYDFNELLKEGKTKHSDMFYVYLNVINIVMSSIGLSYLYFLFYAKV